MKAHEIRSLTEIEIRKRIAEAKEELMTLNFRKELRQLANPAGIRKVRKEIARLQTVLNQRQRGAAIQAAPAVQAEPMKKEQ